MNEKIIVVIPYYNDSKYIRSAVKSIKEQTYKGQIDIIVWNDGSSTDEAEVLNNIEGITVYHNEHNLGLVKTLNKSIEYAYANGFTYYLRNDVDDRSTPSRVKNTLFAMKRSKIDIFSSNRIQSDGLITTFPNSDKDIKHALMEYNPLTHSSICFNLNTISKKDLIYDEKYIHAEDFALWRKLASLGYRFYQTPETLIEYLINQNGITANHRDEQERSVRRAIRDIRLSM